MARSNGESDPTGGFSNITILIVALTGLTSVFIVLLILCLKSPQTVEEGEEMNYEQALQEANVSTLTRSQRRARAKLLMKKNRRLVNHTMNTGAGGDGDQPPHLQNRDADADVGMDPDGDREENIRDGPHAALAFNPAPKLLLTRKQRQKAAKELERSERKANEEQIRIQKLYQEEERQIRAAIQMDKKIQAEIDKKEQLEDQFRNWKYMFPESDLDTRVTVKEFVEELQENPVISLEETAEEFSVSINDLIRRLKELEADGRICHGIINSDNDEYIFINEQRMEQVATYVHEIGCASLDDIASEIANIVGANCRFGEKGFSTRSEADTVEERHEYDKKNQ